MASGKKLSIIWISGCEKREIMKNCVNIKSEEKRDTKTEMNGFNLIKVDQNEEINISTKNLIRKTVR